MLRNLITKDNKLFFNTSEFAEEHTINGVLLPVVIDEDKLSEMKINSKYAPDLAQASCLIFIQKSDLGYIPAKGSLIAFDEQTYSVTSVVADDLVLEIALSEAV